MSRAVSFFPQGMFGSMKTENRMTVNIRLATVCDAAIIADFNAAIAIETENLVLNHERLGKGTMALLADSTKGKYFLAEVNGKIAGQLMITYEWSDWRNATFWWIQSVYVLPEFRKHGIFRKLYEHVQSLAKTSGDVCGLRLYVDSSNTRAQQVYESLGMIHSHYQLMDADIVLK
jgi:GNAT superfamily N-acetyltransferase